MAIGSIVSILKSTVAGQRPTNNVKIAGQPYVNFADMQLGVMDTAGKHQDLLPITFWKAHSKYAINAMVVYNGKIYKCKTANTDASWKIVHWVVETDLNISWNNVTGKPTTFPINASATRLIAAAKKAGTDATALTVVNKAAIRVNKTAAAAAMSKATAADTLSKANKTGVATNKAETIKNKAAIAAISVKKGAHSGYAELDTSGHVPTSQLPSYVDDVIEAATKAAFPHRGAAGVIYVDASTNLAWRWSGRAYVEIAQGIVLGETSSSAYRGDHGKANARAIALNKTGVAHNKTGLAAHIAKTTSVHGATSAATANKIVIRDSHGGASFADIVASSMHLTGVSSPPHAATGFMVQTGTTDKKLYSIPTAVMKQTLGITTNTTAIAHNKTAAAAAMAKAVSVSKMTGPPGTDGTDGAPGAKAVVHGGTAVPTGGATGDLYIQY